MSWGRFPVEANVRMAFEQPRHAELMRAIAKPNTAWERNSSPTSKEPKA